MKRNYLYLCIAALSILAAGCSTTSTSSVQKALVDNPDILIKAIEANPVGVIEALNKAAQKAQMAQGEKQREAEKKARAEELKNPLKPNMDNSRAQWGKADAPITIVEYSDFECPYCSRGHATIKQLQEKYGDRMRLLFKHLPLGFHKYAKPAAEYFEAIAMQDGAKAYKFHDLVFENQGRIKEGDKFLDEMATKAGADLAKVKKDAKSDTVAARLKSDAEEAASFKMEGTPGFIVNGVALRGAFPLDDFVDLIEMSLKSKA